MGTVSRRLILKAGAGLSVLSPLRLTEALAAAPAIRYNARSAQGRAMLKIYAQAVARMMQTPEADPVSWTFQWYTHFVKGAGGTLTSKEAELQRIHGSSDSAHKRLARTMWGTGQPHMARQNPDTFLPWHRMYVYYFEQIIRKVSGDYSFALPYWDYTDPAQQALPEEFRKPQDPLFKSLYRPHRTLQAGSVNLGVPITTASGAEPGDLNLDSMLESEYSGESGFCSQLEGGLHGNVHVFTGNALGMGSVPWAANDPVFWLHHCNIDRVWASWNAAGHENPTDEAWKKTSFTFANPDGTPIEPVTGDFLDTVPLNYTYDVLLKAPSTGGTAAALAAPQAIRVGQGGALQIEPLTVKLAKVDSAAPSLKSVAGTRQVYLQISDVSADEQPGMAYVIYLDLPEGQAPDRNSPHRLGVLTFFNAVGHSEKSRLINITRPLKLLKGKLGENPTLTFIPTDEPAADSNPSIGQVSLLLR